VASTGTTPLDRAVRGPFAYSPNGRYAVCALLRHDGQAIERWNLDARPFTHEIVPSAALPVRLAIDDHGTVQGLSRDHDRFVWHTVGPTRHVRTMRASDCGFATDHPDLVAAYRDGQTTLWTDARVLARADGYLAGGLRLDTAGKHLTFNRLHGAGSAPVVVDTGTGQVATLNHLTDAQVLLTEPRSGRLLLATDISTRPKLATATLVRGDPTRTGQPRPLHGLNATEGSLRPLAFDPDRAVLHVAIDHGLRSTLVQYGLDDDISVPQSLPLGVIAGPARHTRAGLVFGFSTPTTPSTLVTPARAQRMTDTAASTQRFTTPYADVEALTYGDWRTASHLVLALHGGPADHWTASYFSLWEELDRNGIAAVAINQRGSTGYGAACQHAITEQWGGPDLHDVLHVARLLRTRRGSGAPPLMLYGVSYGAFLAVLAAAADPAAFSHCVAVAPFLNGERLYRDGTAAVRQLVDRLGGRTPANDELGPRDLLDAAPRVTAETLIVHGTDDPVIPVSHSRELHARLTGCRSRYVEVAGAGHPPAMDPLIATITAFLTAAP
jgi:alpha-beta hydrolase superfamily lysophospholipase